MVRYFSKWLRNKTLQVNEKPALRQQDSKLQESLDASLDYNVNILQSIYEKCSDIIFHSFKIGGITPAALIFFEGLSNMEELHGNALSPLMLQVTDGYSSIHEMVSAKIPVSHTEKIRNFAECVEFLSNGNPVLLWEGENQGIALGLTKWEKRGIEEPSAEITIRGPREGFTETIQVNISQLRRIIKSPAFKMESMKIGKYTKTAINIAYIEGVAEKNLIEEVRNRLQKINIDSVLESGYIEEFIQDNPFSPFPQLLSTERPDVAAANLLEGRVALLIGGTPFVLIAPTTFFSLLQSPEDYYHGFLASTLIRWLRYISLVMSLLFPSLYVAVLTFHQEMVPTDLLVSVASSREYVPFPALVEAIIMEVTFEALREAGVRLPKQIGAAVSIVGALVIGQAAVEAGLVSAPMVIVVAITGISSFMVPRYVQGISFRIMRFPIILLAGSLGLLGIMLGVLAIISHLCTLRSFGVPYLTPMAPMKFRQWKDVLIRSPWWMMNTRPHFTGEYNAYRETSRQKPDPTRGDE